MSDQNVREIQLGGKQLVFLFMTSVVLAVAIFLLGISVGRGVGAPVDQPTGTDATVADEPPPADMPPPTETTPADVSYHDQLQGQTPPPPQAQPAETAKPPAPADTTSVAVTPPAVASSSPAPVNRPATKPAETRPQAGAGWFVQVNAFKSRENADKQVSQLTAKGYAASVQSDPGSLFRVRVGPFTDRAEATRTAERLQREDGIRASVGR